MNGGHVWPVMFGRWDPFPVAVFTTRAKAREWARTSPRFRVGTPIRLDPSMPTWGDSGKPVSTVTHRPEDKP